MGTRDHHREERDADRPGDGGDGRNDAYDVLRRANPVDLRQLPTPAGSVGADALLEEILATPRAPLPVRARRGPSHRRRWMVPTTVGASLALAGVAYALSNQATESLGVGCYEEASLQADTAVMSADGRPPTEICAQLWPDAYGGPAPELVACVLESGTVGVFPGRGEEACSTLGLVMLSGEYPTGANADAIALRDGLVERFMNEPCLDHDSARRIVGEELAAMGLAGWQIEEGGGIAGEGFSAVRPCAGLAFDEAARTVILVPGPQASG